MGESARGRGETWPSSGHLPAFEEYQRYYLETYGKEIDLTEMLFQLAAASVDSDRTFKLWSRQRSCAEHAAAPQ